MINETFNQLIKQVHQCTLCKEYLPFEPRPIIQVHSEAKLLIVGQAPGLKAHQTGIPWNDASGERLREWLDLSNETFYDEKIIAILPIGFCYPGKGIRGDSPPRKECFNLWHDKLRAHMTKLELVLLIGSYAQHFYLKDTCKKSLTETVRAWKGYLPTYIPLPHPSPLNNLWLHKNRWFEENTLSSIRKEVKSITCGGNSVYAEI